MNLADPHIHFTKLKWRPILCFDHPPYTLALATKMLEVFESESLDCCSVHYAIPHSVSAMLARSMAGAAAVAVITTRIGTDLHSSQPTAAIAD